MTAPLRILHTSDWHLGRRLYGHARYDEFAQFLQWLYDCIIEQKIDVLIVAGDIFDTMTPSNKAQALYYQFLANISDTCCQHVIIVAGNHDSPSLLDAPKTLLKFLNVHIVGTACENIEDEVITLTDKNQQPQAIILAVPYLRDKDVRNSFSVETSDDKSNQMSVGIQQHYAKVAKIAKQQQAKIAENYHKIPIIATGHLMAIGGKTTDDDGVRDLYIGNLGGISANIFDPCIDYVALGHLHVPQLVGNQEHIRYSGSPIAMGFGEAKQQKQVLLITFKKNKTQANIKKIAIPYFHQLMQIKGDFPYIETQLNELKSLNKPVWVEVIYQSDKIMANLNEQLSLITQDSKIDIIKIKNTRTYQQALTQSEKFEPLHELSSTEVFQRCLQTNKIDESQQQELLRCFQEIIYEINHEEN